MENPNTLLRATIIVRALSLILAGCGLYGLTELVISLKIPHSLRPVGDLLFPLVFRSLIFLVCGWWLRAASRGWNHRTAGSVRQLCAASGTVGYFLFITLAARLNLLNHTAPPEPPWHMMWELIAAAFFAVVYILFSRRLVSQLGLHDERSWAQQKRSLESGLGWLIFLLWGAGFGTVQDLMEKKYGPHYTPNEPWGILAFLGPVFLAAIIYKLSVHLLLPPKPTEGSALPAR